MSDRTTSIAELRDLAVRFRDERDWAQFHKPKDLALAIGIESGELAELFLWRDEQEIEEQLQQDDYSKRVADELADVQLFLLFLSEATDVDIAAAVRDKLEQNRAKYPVDKSYGSARKYDELED